MDPATGKKVVYEKTNLRCILDLHTSGDFPDIEMCRLCTKMYYYKIWIIFCTILTVEEGEFLEFDKMLKYSDKPFPCLADITMEDTFLPYYNHNIYFLFYNNTKLIDNYYEIRFEEFYDNRKSHRFIYGLDYEHITSTRAECSTIKIKKYVLSWIC